MRVAKKEEVLYYDDLLCGGLDELLGVLYDFV
jgi:hypothetical protein